MTAHDAAKVLAGLADARVVWRFTRDEWFAALAAAALDHGPLVEDVECPTRTGSIGHHVCPDCSGTGTVRVVVHLADAVEGDQ